MSASLNGRRTALDILPRHQALTVAAELAAEVVDHTRQGLAADNAKDKWIAFEDARRLAEIGMFLIGYVQMFEVRP